MTMKTNMKGSDWSLEGWDPNTRRLSYRNTTLIKVNGRQPEDVDDFYCFIKEFILR